MGKDSVDDNHTEEEKRNSREVDVPLDENEASKMALAEGDNAGHDDAKVVFSPASDRNGDAKIDIETGKTQFCGMSKEELMKFANDPFWIRLRWAVFILFWLAWIAMLVGAIIIVVLAPKCTPEAKEEWWQKETVYQVYPQSFKDGKGDDGFGDLVGIKSKLDYLKDLGVKILWLNPVYKSPMKDMGYDVSDYKAIDPIFGTMDDFKDLVKAVDAKGLHLVMDFVPNHSSDQHEWFGKSVRREGNYTDYYVWADPKTGAGGARQPPNNWLSIFGGSAWEWNDERGQYYYHQFLKDQPDLNYRSKHVVKEMENVVKFWLDLGVDGFRIDAIDYLVESADLSMDEASLPGKPAESDVYDDLDHSKTRHQPETMGVLHGWRKICDAYEDKDKHHRLLMAEVYAPLDETMDYYGNSSYQLADFPFNFELLSKLRSAQDLTGITVNETISGWLNSMPSGKWANWVIGNHDNSRVATRLGTDYVDAMNMITQLLPGTAVTYYGEELGMTDTPIPSDRVKDLSGQSRDPERTPMQWDSTAYAGFSTVEPWLPVNPNYDRVNVAVQSGKDPSHLNVYKELTKLRGSDAAKSGQLSFPVVTSDVFSFMKYKSGSSGFVVLINFSDSPTVLNLQQVKELGKEVTVITRSVQASNDATKPKAKVAVTDIPVGAHEGLVVSFESSS